MMGDGATRNVPGVGPRDTPVRKGGIAIEAVRTVLSYDNEEIVEMTTPGPRRRISTIG